MGSLLNKSDRASGVSQASPGSGSNGGYVTSGWDGSVPDGSSIVRMKVQDAPVSASTTSGMLQVHAEYEFMESLFDGADTTPNPDSILLTVDHTEITDSNSQLIKIIPNPKEAKVEIRRGGHFISILRGLSLQPGSYSNLTIFLKPTGQMYMNERLYTINVDTTNLTFSSSFAIEAGKFTSLSFQPEVELGSEFFKDKGHYSTEPYTKLYDSSSVFESVNANFRLPLNLVSVSQAIYKYPEKLHVMFGNIKISDKGGSGQDLNTEPTQFEILSLNNGLVGLASHNEIKSGEYASVDVNLARNAEMELDGERVPIAYEERSQINYKIYGKYIAKNNHIFEMFLHLDPSKSLFYVPNKGFVFDPFLELESTISFTEEQYNLLGTTLGKEQNKIARTSDLVIQATVQTITPTTAPNVQGVTMIYSDISFQVEEVLRGSLDSDTLNLRFIGGDLNGMQLRVSSMPLFAQGERVILYLQKNGNSYSVVRGHAGKVSITGSSPFVHKWEGSFPIVSFKVNPNLTSQNGRVINNQIEQTQKSGNLWSFNNTKSHISFKFEGTTTGSSATSPTLACDFDTKKANLALEKKIYTGVAGNPDCTSESCSYIWICNGNAVHFDTEINSNQHSFDVISDAPADYNLQTVLNKELGRVAGLPPVANDATNPTQMVLFRDTGVVKLTLADVDLNSIQTYYSGLLQEELDMLNTMQAFKSVADTFCVSPCLNVSSESNQYQVSSTEQQAWNKYLGNRTAANLETFFAIRDLFVEFQRSYFRSYITGISAEEYMQESITHKEDYITEMPTEFLDLYLQTIYVDILNRERAISTLKYELDPMYYTFLDNERKVLMQLRRRIIDEKSNR